MRDFEQFKSEVIEDLEEMEKIGIAGAADAVERVRRGKHNPTIQDSIAVSKVREVSDLIIHLGSLSSRQI